MKMAYEKTKKKNNNHNSLSRSGVIHGARMGSEWEAHRQENSGTERDKEREREREREREGVTTGQHEGRRRGDSSQGL